MKERNIAFIGATGNLGRPVVNALVNHGFQVTALVRNVDKAKRLLPGAVHLVKGDLKNLLEIEQALEGADYLYLNLSPDKKSGPKGWQAEREGLANALAIAKKHRIQRVGYIASIVQRYQGMNDFDWWVFEMKNLAVDKIKESGLPYAIFYPSNFMETLPTTIQGNKMIFAGKPQHKNWWIAGQDYGKQVAKAFEIIPPDENRDYIIQGPEPYDFHEANKIFMQHYARQQLKSIKMPLWAIRFLGIFSKEANYGAHIIEAIDKYPEQFEAQPTWAELGKPKTTLEEFSRNIK